MPAYKLNLIYKQAYVPRHRLYSTGPVLYNMTKASMLQLAHPKVALQKPRVSSSNLPLISIPRPARMPNGPAKAR